MGWGSPVGFALTGLGRLAQWWPALDLVNNGLPVLAAGAIALCTLAVVTRDWRSIALAALLAAINVGLIVAGLAGAAAEAAPDAKRFLRVATFNLWFENERIDEVDTFLNQTDADVVMLQEVTGEHLAPLHKGLDARYPYSVGDFGIVIFSKYAIKADGRVDRAGYPELLRYLRGGSSSTCTAPPSKWSACIARGLSTPCCRRRMWPRSRSSCWPGRCRSSWRATST